MSTIDDAATSKRRFLVYCPVTEETVQGRLGTAEYSYYFVMKGFLPVLERMGEVVRIDDPALQADELFRAGQAEGIATTLVCFCPPPLAPVGLTCPTTVVLAWEFDSVPTEPWGSDPRNDWRVVLDDHNNAVTLSTHSRDTVARAMREQFLATAIPVPVFDRITDDTVAAKVPDAGPKRIEVQGRVVDTRALEVTPDVVRVDDPMAFRWETWDGEPRLITFEGEGEGQRYLQGFYGAEPWGAWSRISEPSIMLPFALAGRVTIRLTAVSYGRNVGRRIKVVVGSSSRSITLSAEPQTYKFTVDTNEPTNLITFQGLEASTPPGATDIRTMGLGLISLELQQKPRRIWRRQQSVAAPEPSRYNAIDLDSVVYTSVLNPEDGRKNWFDIITAFAYALRECDDATLVLKMTHHSMGAFLGDLMSQLRLIGPTRCRIIAIHGYLDDTSFANLINATTYYVNASRGEGLCLPLMEFMCRGVPAVAPDHTAMADYIDPTTTFVVGSSPVPTQWPSDPSARIRTLYRRIDWQSLVDQFRESYRVATTEPDRYRAMSAAAIEVQRHFSSDARVAELLGEHLSGLSRVDSGTAS